MPECSVSVSGWLVHLQQNHVAMGGLTVCQVRMDLEHIPVQAESPAAMSVPDLEIARTRLVTHPKIRIAMEIPAADRVALTVAAHPESPTAMESPAADSVALTVVAHPESPIVKAALILVPKAVARQENPIAMAALISVPKAVARQENPIAKGALETRAHLKIRAVKVALETRAHLKIQTARVDLTRVSKVVARLESPAAKIVLKKIRAAKDYVKMATVATPAHGSMLDYP